MRHLKRTLRKAFAGDDHDAGTTSKNEAMPQQGGNQFETPVPRQVRKCTVHKAPIEGLSYICPSCNSIFCLACITNVLLPEGQCMVCNAPLEIEPETRRLIDRSLEIGDMSSTEVLPDESITMLAPEIWKRFEELQLDDDIIEEVIDRMKYVPPEDRLKYLDAYFADTDMNDDDH
ncbi:MAG TPA: hypothetical protein VKM55_27940 [Candidatus Lokiarchaeia archaeon]|nr:hypothetical protein [Candidatus Lokiarchaeia archaeon]